MQASSEPAEFPDDPRLMSAVQEYLEELEAGRHPNRQEFLRRFPDLAEPLAQCLAGLELVHKAAGPDRKDAPGAAGISLGPDSVVPSNPLGDFQLIREIGRGGMGIVYEAIQLSLGRRVALKVLPFAATFDTKHLQRFQNEARAAALLHHTNIVPVYAVGFERGVHFYAMQLIEGHSLATVIRQVQRKAERPVSIDPLAQRLAIQEVPTKDKDTAPYATILPLPNDIAHEETVSQIAAALSTHRTGRNKRFFTTAARFVMQAAAALEHAHQFGITHRDIKPGNLLVDAHGRLWITDFGLAQFNTDAGLTRTGDIMGTLRYMSPEQASGQRLLLDHRTDIYSLGATLYELITLEPMFPDQDHKALLFQIINDEARAPRSIDKSVPVDLETIILKAVGKHPADRYATAQEFADDLQRFLDDKPIQAKRPSLADRARKWRRRHPSFVAAAAVLLVLVTAGSLASAYIIRGEQEKAEKRADEADARFELARRSVNEMIAISEEELADNPFTERPRKRLLEAALNYYQEFIELRKDDPKAQEELIATQDYVKRILAELALLQGVGHLDLLKQKSVLEDLFLNDDQRKEVDNLSKRLEKERGESFRKFKDNSPAVRRKEFLDLARANDDEAQKILGLERMNRLSQIARQLQGLAAFRDPHVATVLKLTSKQREDIRAIEAKTYFWGPPPDGKHPDGPPPGGRRSPEGPRPNGPRDDFRKIQEEKQKEALDEVLKLLTADQTKAWNELRGNPFTGKIDFFPHFGGPPGPRP